MKKVPVILQMEAAECGAASLAMILAYYKRYVSLDVLRRECGVSRDGSNAYNIVKAAQYNGLIAKVYKKEPNDLKKMKFPMIIHWNFNHFVVLCGFRGDKAVIHDPACGTVLVSPDVFDRSFTGISLCFEPGDDFVAEGKKTSVVSFLMAAMSGSRSVFVYLMLLGVVLAMVGLVTPLFSRLYIDRVLLLGDLVSLRQILLGMGMTGIVMAAALFLEGTYLTKLKAKLAVSANAAFFWHILNLPISFFSARYSGDLIGRQASNEVMAELLCTKIAPVLIHVSMIFFYLIVMIRYDPLLALIATAMAVVNLLVLFRSGKKREDMTRRENRDQGGYAGTLASGIEMMETIKASACEAGTFEKWSGYGTKYLNSKDENTYLEHYLSEIPVFLTSLLNAVILFIGIFKILNGQFTIGMLIAFQGFLLAFLNPISALAQTADNMQEFGGHIERIDDVMKSKEEETAGYESMGSIATIELRDLSFSYSPLTHTLIDGFQLTIQAGESVALVGSSGSGKSSVAKLIGGLFIAQRGEVLFDGKPKSAFTRESFYESVAMVDQDIMMFEGNVFDNITMWDDKVPYEYVLRAAKDACIHADIMERPGGYQGVVLEGGKNFSGGQRQRIEIARALVKNPKVLIMDEATSALDTKTEYEVMEAIKRRGITLIIVAHRLSTIRDCDQIIVLEQGQAVERGTHDALMQAGHVYANLINRG